MGLSGAKACVAAGAKVVAMGRDAESVAAAQQSLGANACVFAGDATDPATAPAVIDLALKQFGNFTDSITSLAAVVAAPAMDRCMI